MRTAGALLAIGLAGCGAPSDEDRAVEFAIEACGIPVSDSGNVERGDDGKVPYDTSSAKVISIDTEPLTNLESLAANLSQSAKAASAAAQLDPVWDGLANSLTDRAATAASVVQLRQQQPDSRYWNWPALNPVIAKYNEGVSIYTAECGGLAARL